jgi:aconitate hydratase
MNFLASPMLVVAYALAGTVDIDLQNDPLGHDKDGNAVYLRDIWPTNEQIRETVRTGVKPEQYTREYGKVFDGDESWKKLRVPTGQTFVWDEKSTYVRNPPFFDVEKTPKPVGDITGARCLALLGDSVTTDHISPAGSISKKSPAAAYLMEHGVKAEDFNSYGARRGNHEVMMRGTFANIRLRNLMLPGVEGGASKFLGRDGTDGAQVSIYDAAMKYKDEGVPLVVIAGAEYGTGSSRDWAAKGTLLLGVRAVIAKSFERIHRSNLVGMGVLPLQFMDGEDAASLGLTGYETFEVAGVAENLAPGSTLEVRVTRGKQGEKSFKVRLRIDTPNEVDYYKHGGILPYVLRQLIA